MILLDMTIPGASSREIVDEAANINPKIRVILTSAYSQEMIAGAMDELVIGDPSDLRTDVGRTPRRRCPRFSPAAVASLTKSRTQNQT